MYPINMKFFTKTKRISLIIAIMNNSYCSNVIQEQLQECTPANLSIRGTDIVLLSEDKDLLEDPLCQVVEICANCLYKYSCDLMAVAYKENKNALYYMDMYSRIIEKNLEVSSSHRHFISYSFLEATRLKLLREYRTVLKSLYYDDASKLLNQKNKRIKWKDISDIRAFYIKKIKSEENPVIKTIIARIIEINILMECYENQKKTVISSGILLNEFFRKQLFEVQQKTKKAIEVLFNKQKTTGNLDEAEKQDVRNKYEILLFGFDVLPLEDL
jgi:hypothetical protein